MEFVSEVIIDQVVNELETQQDQEGRIQQLEQTQPNILSYLLSDNFKLFSEVERDYLLFMVLVLSESSRRVHEDFPTVTAEQIESAEEKNWAVLENVKTKDQRARWTPFFDNYPQEDLLAFVEDALEPDDESRITQEGREFIFVSLKSIIDGFIQVL